MLVAENKVLGGSLWDELQLGNLLAESGAVLNGGLGLTSPPKHHINLTAKALQHTTNSPTNKIHLSPKQGKVISRLADPIRGRYFKYDELMGNESSASATSKKHLTNQTTQSQYTSQQHSQVCRHWS